MTIQQQLELAVSHHQAGRLREAEAIYRQILSRNPRHAGAMILLGGVAVGQGRLDEGIRLLRLSIGEEPRYADAYYNLGIALQAKTQVDEAIQSFRQAIRLRPEFADAHINLGIVLQSKGRLDEAIAAIRQAIRLKPNSAEAYYNLGIPLEAKGELNEAVASYCHAIRLKPDFALAHGNLGNALLEMGKVDEAIASYEAAARIRPDDADVFYNLGIALQRKGRLDEAIAAHGQAIQLQPASAKIHNNLGNAMKETGQLEEAIDAYRRAISLKPDFTEAHSNLIFTLNYHPGHDARAIQAELRRWGERQAELGAGCGRSHGNDRSPARRLRIGYVSPDFCQHVVGRNLMPLLKHHDHDRFEIFCYANVARADGLTDEFQRLADAWRSIVKMTDLEAADLVKRDGIDILVDLALHTGGNRLGIMARKPAPVQVTFAGYPGSTGLSAIDYRLTDPHLEGQERAECVGSERPHALPHSFWCYDPLVAEIPVGAPPSQSLGFITFGCLNNFCKINAEVVQVWARVFKAVADSRMLLICPEGSSRERIRGWFESEGIDPRRAEFASKQSRVEYLHGYNRIDIGLDTFPYNGHTTSLDSLWMGVPVVTMVGRTIVGRAGLSQLTNIGMPELVARTPVEFAQIAADLAGDAERLGQIRSGLRLRMSRSPLMDAVGFARGIEEAYREMWREWCENKAASESGG